MSDVSDDFEEIGNDYREMARDFNQMGLEMEREVIIDDREDNEIEEEEETNEGNERTRQNGRTGNIIQIGSSSNVFINQMSINNGVISLDIGNGGSYEMTSTQTRAGSGGVVEICSKYENRGTGEKKIVIERKIGNRSRKITRKKMSDGQELTYVVLSNLESDQVSDFDREWTQRAQRQELHIIN